MPKVSVIVPVYKAERYLDACVESLLAQTLCDFELILVDDGSPDSSPAMCDSWAEKDERIRAIHQQNGGPSVARRTGVAAAKAEYITFLDADDTFEPEALEKMYSSAEEHDADIVACNFRRVKEDGTVVPTPGTELIPGLFSGSEICGQFMRVKVSLTIIPAKLYRKWVLEQVVYPERERLVEDEAIAHQLMYPCSRVVCLADALYNYIDHESAETNSARIATVRLLDAPHAFLDRMRYFKARDEEKFFGDAVMIYAYSIYLSFGRMPACKLCEFASKLKQLQREFALELKAASRCEGLPIVHRAVLAISACPTVLWLMAKATKRFALK